MTQQISLDSHLSRLEMYDLLDRLSDQSNFKEALFRLIEEYQIINLSDVLSGDIPKEDVKEILKWHSEVDETKRLLNNKILNSLRERISRNEKDRIKAEIRSELEAYRQTLSDEHKAKLELIAEIDLESLKKLQVFAQMIQAIEAGK